MQEWGTLHHFVESETHDGTDSASLQTFFANALVSIALPGSALMPATSPDPLAYAREAGRQSVRLAKMKNMKPSDIVTMDIMVLMKTILKIRRKDTQH